MKIPNAQAAYVERSKLTEYLLSTTHPIGRSKAVFLRTLGFADDSVGGLEQGLVAIAKTEEVVDVERSEYGMKYTIDGPMDTPGGRARTNCLDHRPRRGETAFCHCLSVI